MAVAWAEGPIVPNLWPTRFWKSMAPTDLSDQPGRR